MMIPIDCPVFQGWLALQPPGLFQCPAYAVFGHADMTPVTHPLPTVAFGVAKGGRWGTALNTPVFKTIWQKAAGCVC